MLFYAALFLLFHGNTAWSSGSQRSQYISRHLDRQTGPYITIGNQRSQFYRTEKESRLTEGCRSSFNRQSNFFSLIHNTACSITWAVPDPVGLWCWWNPTWSSPDQALAACRVTSAKGLSLPLCSHLASSSPQLYFPIPLSKDLCLLASSCYAQTVFSFNSCVIQSIYQYLFSLLVCTFHVQINIIALHLSCMLLSKATYNKCNHVGVYPFWTNK